MRNLLKAAQEGLQTYGARLNGLEGTVLEILRGQMATWSQINQSLQSKSQAAPHSFWIGLALLDLYSRGFVQCDFTTDSSNDPWVYPDSHGSNRLLPAFPTLAFSARSPNQPEPVPVRVRTR